MKTAPESDSHCRRDDCKRKFRESKTAQGKNREGKGRRRRARRSAPADRRNQSQLVKLFNQRARLAQQIGLLKQDDGTPIYQPARERQVIERVLAFNQGPLSGEHLRRIFPEIISACTALEHPMRVAYLGPEHT